MRINKYIIGSIFTLSMLISASFSFFSQNTDDIYVKAETMDTRPVIVKEQKPDLNQEENTSDDTVEVPQLYNHSLINNQKTVEVPKLNINTEKNIDIEMEDDSQSKTVVASAIKEETTEEASVTDAEDGSETGQPVEDGRYGEYLGNYLITGYCPCAACCGKTNGITASGTQATEGRTIAAPANFPFGTKLIIDGYVYTVEDRGGAVNGKHIDMFYNSHSDAYCSTHYSDVYYYVED